MKTKKPQLIASSSSLEGIIKLVKEFYCTEYNFQLWPEKKNTWRIQNYGRADLIEGVRIRYSKQRYRFEIL